MIAKLPLVPFVIINLMRLMAGVCMEVRFKKKRFFSSRRFAICLCHSFAAQEKPLGRG